MKQYPKHGRGKNLETEPTPDMASELAGWVELGKKDEALKLARRIFRQRTIRPEAFNEAVDALVTLADALKRWSPVVESAYARLTKRAQRAVRHSMLNFYYSADNFESARCFIPRRFEREANLLDLAFGLDTLLELGRIEDAGRVARRVALAIEEVEDLTTVHFTT